jgi:hypothetical protein
MAHKVESHLCNLTARQIRLAQGRRSPDALPSADAVFAIVIRGVKISTGGEHRVHK